MPLKKCLMVSYMYVCLNKISDFWIDLCNGIPLQNLFSCNNATKELQYKSYTEEQF